MKKLILSLALVATLLSPICVFAETTPTVQDKLTQQIIVLLQQIIVQLQQQIADILAKQSQTASIQQSITPQPIVNLYQYANISSPKLGDKWVRGKTYKIEWAAGGIDKILIHLHNDSPYVVNNPHPDINLVPEGISASLGYYDYTVPPAILLDNRYKVFLSGKNSLGNFRDLSESNHFSIVEK